MKTLRLVLKKHWYDMIANGDKCEEYRDITPYWRSRFFKEYKKCELRTIVTGDPLTDAIDTCSYCKKMQFRHYDFVTFYMGYAKNRPQMTFPIESITIGIGRKEWGALPYKTFIIKFFK